MISIERISAESNIELILRERGKIMQRRESHNIVTNIGRQFMAEVITATSFAGPTFVRTSNQVVRYMGFGIGGSRQTTPGADAAPFSTDYPGVNTQTDIDLTVSGLERPVAVSGTANTPGVPSPAVWMKEVATPPTFPTATSTRFVALFTQSDFNFATYSTVALSEIALYRGDADPTTPNGNGGAYPGAGGLALAYDTFNPVNKTGLFSIEVRWEWRF